MTPSRILDTLEARGHGVFGMEGVTGTLGVFELFDLVHLPHHALEDATHDLHRRLVKLANL